jgi:hypothetical protein
LKFGDHLEFTWLLVIDYWCLVMDIILLAIGAYSINDYWCLIMDIILLTIGAFSIGGY